VVFTNVQVQSRKTTHTVKKLAYIRRGPYTIVRSYPSGSYELQLLSNANAATIKKHGSDLYLSPERLIPHSPTQSSDQLFADTNKPIVKEPYKLAGLDGYNPAQPWKEATAQAQLNAVNNQAAPKFPALAELDQDYDGWPDNTNPFISKEASETPKSLTDRNLVLTAAPAPTISTPQLITSIVRSEDKLFFIAHAATATAGRKEWKLVQVNFTKSIQQQPTCLQNGRFLMDFYIEHHRDGALDIRDRRFWLEYHRSNSHKTISTRYHILQPSQFSERTATNKDLVPYREWINLSDPTVNLLGPFDFATINNRKTRDRVPGPQWSQLQAQKTRFDNDAPVLRNRAMMIDVSQPIYETITTDTEVARRCTAFMGHLEVNDETLALYGHTVQQ
jgi:hypothetical protein